MTVQRVQEIILHAPGDRRAYSIDFSPDLPEGTSVVSVSWVATSLTKSLEILSENIAQVYLAGGTDGVDYVATCTATTSASEIISRSILLKCRKL